MCRLLPDLGSDLANTETHSRQIKRSTDQSNAEVQEVALTALTEFPVWN